MLMNLINLCSQPGLFILLSFLLACLEISYQIYMENNMILQPWRKRVLNKLPKKIGLILGICPFCNGFWIAIIGYFITFQPSIDILLFTGFNAICILILSKIQKL